MKIQQIQEGVKKIGSGKEVGKIPKDSLYLIIRNSDWPLTTELSFPVTRPTLDLQYKPKIKMHQKACKDITSPGAILSSIISKTLLNGKIAKVHFFKSQFNDVLCPVKSH